MASGSPSIVATAFSKANAWCIGLLRYRTGKGARGRTAGHYQRQVLWVAVHSRHEPRNSEEVTYMPYHITMPSPPSGCAQKFLWFRRGISEARSQPGKFCQLKS